jgi:uncharacterized protein YcbK (DUF882 family)
MKTLSYILNTLSLSVAAVVMWYAYRCLQLFLIMGAGLALLYLLVAWLIGRKLRGWWKWSFYFVFLQLVPVCMSVGLFGLTMISLSPAAVGGRNEYEMAFTDVQFVQSVSAKINGVTPFAARDEFKSRCDQLKNEGKLVKVSTNSLYYVRPLYHSSPYLVPKAEVLLEYIASEFQKISNTNAKFAVTSVLRTKEDVKKLQKVNANATTNSCHCYGTTFDISYAMFIPDLLRPKSNAELRNALSEALYKLRADSRCYVKFETKQHCYHITVR